MSDRTTFFKSPKGPKGKIITGNLKAFRSDPPGFLTQLATEFGEVVKFRLGPLQNFYLVSDPEMIKQILVTKQKNFMKSDDFKALKPIFGEGLLTSDKEFHMQQRRLIQPAFKKSHIIDYGQNMIDVASDYLSTWKDGEERIITQDMMSITLGVICKTMFNIDFKEGYQKIGQPIETAMNLAVRRMRSLIQLPLWVPTKRNRDSKKAIRSLDHIIAEIIQKRRNDPAKHEDMLGIIMDARDDIDGLGMSDKQVRDELMTIFIAGHETTANALSWTLYLLSQHPEVEAKMYEEINRVIGSRPPTPDDFMKLTYTQNIMWESMRLYPPAFVTSRKVDKDVEIKDYRFKKGDVILVSQYVMHRKPEYFQNPTSFIPERFENNFIKTIPSYAFFPFGGGPRVCIGNHFAMMEAVLVLVTIAQRFRLKLAPDHHVVKNYSTITLRPKRGLRMIIQERNLKRNTL
ncbi:cytochrome P450 [Niallia nealsonii]|uniref:Cytochrome P450 n=1 Tax=Niallia nealsonii TaxID=115979 RepID=A0A2N0Z2W4_9BACI|nr:cytochrome P450 [Niallia nealsonii]PKG23837.1 cytochrome P450 [Niallia nealsonii]